MPAACSRAVASLSRSHSARRRRRSSTCADNSAASAAEEAAGDARGELNIEACAAGFGMGDDGGGGAGDALEAIACSRCGGAGTGGKHAVASSDAVVGVRCGALEQPAAEEVVIIEGSVS